jgi:hypothetical protein
MPARRFVQSGRNHCPRYFFSFPNLVVPESTLGERSLGVLQCGQVMTETRIMLSSLEHVSDIGGASRIGKHCGLEIIDGETVADGEPE